MMSPPSKVVYKYTITHKLAESETSYVAFVPPSAQLLDVQYQRGHVMLWALVNPDEQCTKLIELRIFFTGEPIPAKVLDPIHWSYFKTLHGPPEGIVYHVFKSNLLTEINSPTFEG